MAKTVPDPRKAGFPFFPLLLGIFPVLSLAAYNLSQMDLASAFRSFLASLALAILLFGLFRLTFRRWDRAALLTAAFLVLFYSYGHVYNLFLSANIVKAAPAGAVPLGLLWAALAGLVAWLTGRKSLQLAAFTPVLNLFSALLLVYPLFQILNHGIKALPGSATVAAVAPAPAPSQPDIYYIILDAYDRSDALKLVYDYDNSAFLSELAGRGFYVANCSQSNYAYTQPSLASSLNLDYLDALSVTSNARADPLLQQNAVRHFLKALGYKIVAFETGFSWSQWQDADEYYAYHPDPAYLNGFEDLFLRTSLLRLPQELLKSDQDATYGVIPHDRVIYVLGKLTDVAVAVRGPKFVFVHLSIPHPPFVFGPEGEFVTQGAENATSVTGYSNSVTFIDRQILQVVDRIIAGSDRPPVIVIQGDHGAPAYPSPLERMTILNAYDLPGWADALYPSISPVNTFRVIFNTYFGTHYSLLPDVSWYSYPNNEYAFTALPNDCQP